MEEHGPLAQGVALGHSGVAARHARACKCRQVREHGRARWGFRTGSCEEAALPCLRPRCAAWRASLLVVPTPSISPACGCHRNRCRCRCRCAPVIASREPTTPPMPWKYSCSQWTSKSEEHTDAGQSAAARNAATRCDATQGRRLPPALHIQPTLVVPSGSWCTRRMTPDSTTNAPGPASPPERRTRSDPAQNASPVRYSAADRADAQQRQGWAGKDGHCRQSGRLCPRGPHCSAACPARHLDPSQAINTGTHPPLMLPAARICLNMASGTACMKGSPRSTVRGRGGFQTGPAG